MFYHKVGDLSKGDNSRGTLAAILGDLVDPD